MASDYTPANWYWAVSGDATRVYSSAIGDYVPLNNATFTAWKDAGNSPTKIASEAELGEVLAQYMLRPTPAGVLDGYTEQHSRKITLEVVAKILLWLVNEVRSLKGQQALNAAQFRAFVKERM